MARAETRCSRSVAQDAPLGRANGVKRASRCRQTPSAGRELPRAGSRMPVRILVVRPGALGDVLLTLPALEALQGRFPCAAIEVMGNPTVLRLLLGRSVVCAASSFDRADLGSLFQHGTTPTPRLQRYLDQFDVIVSYAVEPTHVFARNLARLARGKVLSVNAQPRAGARVHISNYLQWDLQRLGVAQRHQPSSLILTAEDQRDAEQWWAEQGLAAHRMLAIHPGSGSSAKNWPAPRFAAVARDARRRYGLSILLLSGPADPVAVREVQQALQGCDYTLVQGVSLQRLAGILARCHAYVGNDSGVSHLAAAVGVPTVVVFGPTDAAVWAPRGPLVRVVRGSAPCAPCDPAQRRGCARRMCLETSSASTVLEALSAVLEAAVSRMRRDATST